MGGSPLCFLDRWLNSEDPVHAAWPTDNIPPEPPTWKCFGPLQFKRRGGEGTEVSAHVSWVLGVWCLKSACQWEV